MSKGVHYESYLQLDKLLSSQQTESGKAGRPAHDETLFIIVHQTYELWFKQILIELESVLKLFETPLISEKQMSTAVSRLERIRGIQKFIVGQVDILETMTPMDFLDFRDLLYPASGFQSFQFRQLEITLGLRLEQRLTYNHMPYHKHFEDDKSKKLEQLEKQSNLFEVVDHWLSRTPFLKSKNFDFWTAYQKSANDMFDNEENIIKNNPLLNEEDKQRNLTQLSKSKDLFASLFSEDSFQQQKQQGQWRLSYQSIRAAIFIQLYRHHPVLHLPYRLIESLIDIDENLSYWRYRHALMARRMLGSKVGTGGSSGHDYLKASTEKHKIFNDFFQLTTFLLPKSSLPELPENFQRELGFSYETGN